MAPSLKLLVNLFTMIGASKFIPLIIQYFKFKKCLSGLVAYSKVTLLIFLLTDHYQNMVLYCQPPLEVKQ